MTPRGGGVITAASLDGSLSRTVRLRGWVRGLVCGECVVGAAVVFGWWQQPLPSVPTVRPALPAVEAVSPGPTVTVALPEALFPKPPPKPAARAAAQPVTVQPSASWRIVGIDVGPPPAALLKETKDGGASVWVKVGDVVGAFTITAIEAGRVVMAGEEGDVELRV